jgi:hypothetical protein
MKKVRKLMDNLPLRVTREEPDQSYVKLFLELGCKTSTLSLFQQIDEELMEQLRKYCDGDPEYNFINNIAKVTLQSQLRKKYPTFMKIVLSMKKNENGMLLSCVGELLSSIIVHTLKFYRSLYEETKEFYVKTTQEVETEVYPQWQIKNNKPQYSQSCTSQDKKAWEKNCKKSFPSHQSLSPGLFIVTCACPNKAIYGFSMMIKHESPSMIFDITTTRFRNEYNPAWVYDAACKAREFGLNREPKRYCKLLFVSDPFHEKNHTACSQSHMSSQYPDLNKLNKEAAEQFNSALESIGKSCTFMGPKLYMTAVSIFCIWQNY